MNNIIVMGMPAAGKGTVCAALAKEFGFAHLSTGEVLRAEQAAGTKLGLMAKRLIEAGNFMPDHIMIPLVKEVVVKSTNTVGTLFDGFPRTKEQAKQLHVFLYQRKQPISAVIFLDVSKKVAVERLLKRAQTEGRADDTEEVISNRWGHYNSKTMPVVSYFSKLGMIKPVPADGTPEEVYEQVRGFVKEMLNVVAE